MAKMAKMAKITEEEVISDEEVNNFNEDEIIHQVKIFESFEDDSIECEEYSLSDLY